MKNLIHFLLVIIVAYLLGLVLPWWGVMVAALLVSYVYQLKKLAVFFIPFWAILLLWAVQTYMVSSTNDAIMAKKIAELLPLGGNEYLLFVVTGIVGGIAAGVAAIFGKQLSSLLKVNTAK